VRSWWAYGGVTEGFERVAGLGDVAFGEYERCLLCGCQSGTRRWTEPTAIGAGARTRWVSPTLTPNSLTVRPTRATTGPHDRGPLPADRGRRVPSRPPRQGRPQRVCRVTHPRPGRLMAGPARRDRASTGGRGSRLGGRLQISARVRKAMRRFCASAGPQHVVLTWPGGANYLPATMHHAGPYDVVVGHVARCPIYADLRQLELFRGHCMFIDVDDAHNPRRLILDTDHHPHPTTRSNTDQAVAGVRGTARGRRRRKRGPGRHPQRVTRPGPPIPSIIHLGKGQTMADRALQQNVEVTDGERVVASAQVDTSPDTPDTARASLHAESGHLPVGSRASLVDAVLDLPELQGGTHLKATIPLGDTESLQRLRQRTQDMTTRAAGSTAIVEAELPDDQ
jgi:hypothetical protein